MKKWIEKMGALTQERAFIIQKWGVHIEKTLKKFLHGEYVAIKKDFGAGVILILTIGVILLLIQVVMKVLAPIVLITNNEALQILLSLGIILILGLLSRKLKENEKTAWLVDFLPSKSMDQPEMTYWYNGNYHSGILLGYREINGPGDRKIKCAAIAKVCAGPTSITLLSPDYIPISEDLKPTGRSMKDVVKELATLGTLYTSQE